MGQNGGSPSNFTRFVCCPSCKFETTRFEKVCYPAFDEKAGCVSTHILGCPQCGLEFAHPMTSEDSSAITGQCINADCGVLPQ